MAYCRLSFFEGVLLMVRTSFCLAHIMAHEPFSSFVATNNEILFVF